MSGHGLAAQLAAELAPNTSRRRPSATSVALQAAEEPQGALGRELSLDGEDGETGAAQLAEDAEPGLVTSLSPRDLRFAIGGVLPIAPRG